MLPESLPGSHLAEVDCNGCGAYIYAVPDYADVALCADCGRTAAGAPAGQPTPAPPSWTGLSGEVTNRGGRVAAPAPASPLPYPARCTKKPPCGWRGRGPDFVTVLTMERVHHQVRHEPWLSGRTGGARR